MKPDEPAHTPGIPEGNSTGNCAEQPGHLLNGRSTTERSTGTRTKDRNPTRPDLSPP